MGRGRREGRNLRSCSELVPPEDLKEKQKILWQLRLFPPVIEGEVPVTALSRPPNKAYRDLHVWICHLTKKASAISLKLGSGKPKKTFLTLSPKTLAVAAAVNEDEDSEP